MKANLCPSCRIRLVPGVAIVRETIGKVAVHPCQKGDIQNLNILQCPRCHFVQRPGELIRANIVRREIRFATARPKRSRIQHNSAEDACAKR